LPLRFGKPLRAGIDLRRTGFSLFSFDFLYICKNSKSDRLKSLSENLIWTTAAAKAALILHAVRHG
jgi:hypothetical protein